jgi:hypothetical protein
MTLTREQIEQWRGALKARYEEFPASIFSITNERICEEIDKLCDMALASLNVVPKPTEKTNDELRVLAELLKTECHVYSEDGPYTLRGQLKHNGIVDEASQAILALLDERDRLREALKPFADAYDKPERGKIWSDLFYIGDCRNASLAHKGMPLVAFPKPDVR